MELKTLITEEMINKIIMEELTKNVNIYITDVLKDVLKERDYQLLIQQWVLDSLSKINLTNITQPTINELLKDKLNNTTADNYLSELVYSEINKTLYGSTLIEDAVKEYMENTDNFTFELKGVLK